MAKHYLAVDLGASSGRTIVGTFANGRLTLEEINRFWNGPIEIAGALHWDFDHLFRNIQEGITLARSRFGDGLISMGVDTWGVDFGLIDTDGKLLDNPVHYRDSRTAGMFKEVFRRVSREEVFARTGVQFMEINTLYQLMALSLEDSRQYRSAARLLFMPDLINYRLTGRMTAERTFASTSQFYNPVTRDWAYDLLDKLGIRTDMFADLVDPGTVIGETDRLPVVAVGSHDTASAFAAVPVQRDEHCAFLSSGTWSLLGTELPEPVIDDDSLTANFTNEVGVCDTIRFLKNLSGLWILQELRRGWAEQSLEYTWEEMAEAASDAEPFRSFVDPSDNAFFAPGDMAGRIQNFCERSGQDPPQNSGQILRAVYEGLALLYADTFDDLESLSGMKLDVLRIVGGGCRNQTLSQFAANATGRRVVSGPIEATAIGNLLVQMLAMGDIQSLDEGRDIVRDSFAHETRAFKPQDVDAWISALAKWRAVRSAE